MGELSLLSIVATPLRHLQRKAGPERPLVDTERSSQVEAATRARSHSKWTLRPVSVMECVTLCIFGAVLQRAGCEMLQEGGPDVTCRTRNSHEQAPATATLM
jgi:hypothetical protein